MRLFTRRRVVYSAGGLSGGLRGLWKCGGLLQLAGLEGFWGTEMAGGVYRQHRPSRTASDSKRNIRATSYPGDRMALCGCSCSIVPLFPVQLPGWQAKRVWLGLRERRLQLNWSGWWISWGICWAVSLSGWMAGLLDGRGHGTYLLRSGLQNSCPHPCGETAGGSHLNLCLTGR